MSDKQKGALILTHLQNEGACTLGETIRQRDFRIKTLNVPHSGVGNIDPLRPDLLVVMGGTVGVYQKEDYPFLKDEIEILKARIAADKPTIGICLGSQLIAASLGGNVYKGKKGKEIGWCDICVTPAGMETPARHLDRSKTKVLQWHGDTFDLPENVQLLASSDQYENQIFTAGKNTLAVQCHPEVRADQLEEWYVMLTGDVTGDNPILPLAQLRQQTSEHVDALNAQASLFFNEWLEERGL